MRCSSPSSPKWIKTSHPMLRVFQGFRRLLTSPKGLWMRTTNKKITYEYRGKKFISPLLLQNQSQLKFPKANLNNKMVQFSLKIQAILGAQNLKLEPKTVIVSRVCNSLRNSSLRNLHRLNNRIKIKNRASRKLELNLRQEINNHL